MKSPTYKGSVAASDRAGRVPEERLESRLKEKNPLYTHGEAVAEAGRCIYCVDAPCIDACPTGIDIPTFIRKIATENVRGAARTILEDNLLGYSCGRSCPVEVLCAGACVYNHWGRPPIEIGRLQRYATETALARDPDLIAKRRAAPTGKRIALIGAGPASLAAAGHLALDGHSAVIYDKKALPGGLNTLGIAPYKLMADDALAEIEFILGLGDIELKTGVEIVSGEPSADGQVAAQALLSEYDAVFIGLGLGPDRGLGVPGADGPGVYGATWLIEQIKTNREFSLEGVSRPVVVGGGNTAIDIARELAQLGAGEVTMVYRGEAGAMSGYAHEMEGARVDGVRLVERRQPIAIDREGDRITGIQLAPVEGGAPDSSRAETVPCDFVALAIGQARLTDLARALSGVELDDRGRVVVDEATCRTANPAVYAGGDCVNGGKEVVNAAQHGKLAARDITARLQA